MHIELSQPIISLLEKLKTQEEENKRDIEIYLPKVKRILEGYAVDMKKVSLNKLTLLDVVNINTNEVGLDLRLIKYIHSLSTPKNKKSVKSHIRRLIKVIFKSEIEGLAVGKNFIEALLPEWMKGLWLCLPKNKDGLTNKSRHVLGILLHVAAEQQVSTIEALMVDKANHISDTAREIYESAVWSKMDSSFSTLRKKLGLIKPRAGKKRSLPFEEWPQTFREQWIAFKKRAEAGPSEELLKVATEYDVTIERLEGSSLLTYYDVLAVGLYIIQWEGDLKLEDLLRLRKLKKGEISNAKKKWVNDLIEGYRIYQREIQTDAKAAGKNSSTYITFINVLKTMAAYEGIFEQREKFNNAYNPKPDNETRDKRREEKKEAYSQEFTDSKIKSLKGEFVKIVKSRSFKSSRRDMRLCLFFIALLTARFMGVRQQALRACTIGINIIFGNVRREITFKWPRIKVKNKRPISIELVRNRDKTHELLIDMLYLFKNYVYEYIKENQGTELKGQLFVKFNIAGKFIPFDNHKTFSQWFSEGSKEFMGLQGKIKGRKQGINPHFLRGFAADWLLDFGISDEDVADLMCISVKTLRTSYASKNRAVNTRPALDNLQMKRRERESLRAGTEVALIQGSVNLEGRGNNDFAVQLVDKVVQAITKRTPSSKERKRINHLKSENAKLKSKLGEQEKLINELRQKELFSKK
jgi:hypothetical protein